MAKTAASLLVDAPHHASNSKLRIPDVQHGSTRTWASEAAAPGIFSSFMRLLVSFSSPPSITLSIAENIGRRRHNRPGIKATLAIECFNMDEIQRVLRESLSACRAQRVHESSNWIGRTDKRWPRYHPLAIFITQLVLLTVLLIILFSFENLCDDGGLPAFTRGFTSPTSYYILAINVIGMATVITEIACLFLGRLSLVWTIALNSIPTCAWLVGSVKESKIHKGEYGFGPSCEYLHRAVIALGASYFCANLYLWVYGILLLIGRRLQDSKKITQNVEESSGRNPDYGQQEQWLKPELNAFTEEVALPTVNPASMPKYPDASSAEAALPVLNPASTPLYSGASDQPPPQSFILNGILYQAMPVQSQHENGGGGAEIREIADTVSGERMELSGIRSTIGGNPLMQSHESGGTEIREVSGMVGPERAELPGTYLPSM